MADPLMALCVIFDEDIWLIKVDIRLYLFFRVLLNNFFGGRKWQSTPGF